MSKLKTNFILTPIFGTIIFLILYFIATLYYPGGSQLDKNSKGFSWINNYWCNLLNENAMNGQHNSAKPIAMSAMFILCVTLSLFWILFPQQVRTGKINKRIIQFSGTLSMLVAFFLFTNINHDLITDVASALGLIAAIGTFNVLYKIKWFGLFFFGLLNILLVVLNNYVYFTKGLIVYLPVIQKISFAAFLIWVCCIDINLYWQSKKTQRTYRLAPG
ncbi:MAG: hypothetical protein ACMG51_06340 [Ginsengibacter sp.]